MIALEAITEVIGQMRIEQRIRHHPQQVDGKELRIGSGRESGGAGQVGEHTGVVLAQRAIGETVAALCRGGSHVLTFPSKIDAFSKRLAD